METQSWPAPAKLVGQRIAVHAGKRLVCRPGDAIERKLRARLGENWQVLIPTGAVVATAVLAGMAQVECTDLLEGWSIVSIGSVEKMSVEIDAGGMFVYNAGTVLCCRGSR